MLGRAVGLLISDLWSHTGPWAFTTRFEDWWDPERGRYIVLIFMSTYTCKVCGSLTIKWKTISYLWLLVNDQHASRFGDKLIIWMCPIESECLLGKFKFSMFNLDNLLTSSRLSGRASPSLLSNSLQIKKIRNLGRSCSSIAKTPQFLHCHENVNLTRK